MAFTLMGISAIQCGTLMSLIDLPDKHAEEVSETVVHQDQEDPAVASHKARNSDEETKLDYRQVVGNLKTATVFVKTHYGTGSGWVIHQDQQGPRWSIFIVSNSHVVAPRGNPWQNRISAVFDSGSPRAVERDCTLVHYDEEADLALLKVDIDRTIGMPSHALKWDTEVELFETQSVIVAGFPFGRELSREEDPSPTVSTGHISSLRYKFDSLDLIQVDADLNPGNSGGPVCLKDGTLIGVSVAGVTGTDISFVIPWTKVRDFIRSQTWASTLMDEETTQVRWIEKGSYQHHFTKIPGVEQAHLARSGESLVTMTRDHHLQVLDIQEQVMTLDRHFPRQREMPLLAAGGDRILIFDSTARFFVLDIDSGNEINSRQNPFPGRIVSMAMGIGNPDRAFIHWSHATSRGAKSGFSFLDLGNLSFSEIHVNTDKHLDRLCRDDHQIMLDADGSGVTLWKTVAAPSGVASGFLSNGRIDLRFKNRTELWLTPYERKIFTGSGKILDENLEEIVDFGNGSYLFAPLVNGAFVLAREDTESSWQFSFRETHSFNEVRRVFIDFDFGFDRLSRERLLSLNRVLFCIGEQLVFLKQGYGIHTFRISDAPGFEGADSTASRRPRHLVVAPGAEFRYVLDEAWVSQASCVILEEGPLDASIQGHTLTWRVPLSFVGSQKFVFSVLRSTGDKEYRQILATVRSDASSGGR